jgi:hypothetical protein
MDHQFAESDRQFAKSFHERTLERFSHPDHLRLAWIIMRGHQLDEGLSLLGQGIRDLAEEQGAVNRYHETLTQFWGRIIHHAVLAHPEIRDFDSFLASFPFLLDKNLPLRHWTTETLWGNSARSSWTEPNIKPLL